MHFSISEEHLLTPQKFLREDIKLRDIAFMIRITILYPHCLVKKNQRDSTNPPGEANPEFHN